MVVTKDGRRVEYHYVNESFRANRKPEGWVRHVVRFVYNQPLDPNVVYINLIRVLYTKTREDFLLWLQWANEPCRTGKYVEVTDH